MKAWTVGVVLFLVAAPLWADTLHLKDGRIVHGEVVSETDEVVSVKEPIGTSGYAQARYPKTQVERIERGPTERAAPPAQIAATPATAPVAATGPTAEQVFAELTAEQQKNEFGIWDHLLNPALGEELRRQAAKGEIANLSWALEHYQAVSGEFPPTQEGSVLGVSFTFKTTQFMAAAEKLRQVRAQLELVKAVTADPWGQPYRYVSPGQHGPYDLFSVGPDGVEGTDDDVTNWK